MTRLKNAKAFSIIEIVVGLVLIGILVALTAFGFNAVITYFKKSAVENSAKQVAKVVAAASASQQVALSTGAGMAAAAAEEGVAGGGEVVVAPATIDAAFTKITKDNPGKIYYKDDGGVAPANTTMTVYKNGYKVTVTASAVTGGVPTVGSASNMP